MTRFHTHNASAADYERAVYPSWEGPEGTYVSVGFGATDSALAGYVLAQRSPRVRETFGKVEATRVAWPPPKATDSSVRGIHPEFSRAPSQSTSFAPRYPQSDADAAGDCS